MTLDAMDWVWKHSRSKGNTRIALLFVADQVRTSAAEVRLSYPELMQAMNTTSRGSVRAALLAAEKSGELEIKEAAAGRRKPLYRLPMAVGYRRPVTGSSPDSGPQSEVQGSVSGPDSGPQASSSGPVPGPQSSDFESASSPESGPQSGRSGPENDPPYPTTPSKQAGAPETQQQDDYGIPAFARPLVDGCTNAGVSVRWPFEGGQWLIVHALIKKSGTTAMVEYARKVAARREIESAKYFMQGWRELPPLPAHPKPTTNRGPAAGKRPHCGHPDCDPITRTREIENDRGLRNLHPCPDCHPTAKGQAA
ncbi:hypothetical protein ACFWRZ_07855 [Streptomyces rubiginosohelvolus]|uniref:hypothetical protein n=1 Tax=Streptomyces rubiginosohelvolus TaxID=67362 RepID=UPI003665A9F3